MEQVSFSREHRSQPTEDKIESSLRGVSEHIISIVFGFLPIILIPVAFLPLDYGKVIIVVAGLALAILFFSLSALRSGAIRATFTPVSAAMWGVAIISLISALFSGDTKDALVGDLLEVNTTLFVFLLALTASISAFMKMSKMSIMRLYIFLTGSAALLAILHVARVIFGPEFLSLGFLSSAVSSTVGSWNDLGLFFGLSVLLSMVALEQLPLTKWGKVVFSIGMVLSLIMLGIINFSAVWWVLGLVSLVMLMYSLVKDRFANSTIPIKDKDGSSLQSVLMSLSVFAVSLLFIVAGGPLGGAISEATEISFLEVRPSFTATTDIARGVYSENAFFGIGPNKFIDAWRLYKDPAINQTIFWDTDFRGGNGFVTTYLVTTGMVGAAAWLLFFGLFLYAGFRMLFKTTPSDRFWYFIGSSSFVAATYLWGMSIVYLPGASILFLAALFTSITMAAYIEIVGLHPRSLSVQRNKKAAIVLVGIVMIVVVGAASSLYYVGRHYSSIYTYAQTLASATPGSTLSELEQGVASAYTISPNDTYARQIANYQLTKINTLLNVKDPTPEQQTEFSDAVRNGVESAQQAVELDPTDALNWSVLGSTYSVLVAAGEVGVLPQAEEALANARKYSPSNPSYVLQEAQLQVRAQNVDRARELINEAIRIKPNYSEALNFLTELEVASGRTAEAIVATRSIINIEPNNPARHYQLAVLLSANNDIEGAITSFEKAVVLNPSYANARYMLALAYAQTDRTDEAISQLEVVSALNPNNQSVVTLIEQLKADEFIPAPTPSGLVDEPEVVVENAETVTTTEVPDSSLISPVNTIPEEADPEPVPVGEEDSDTEE